MLPGDFVNHYITSIYATTSLQDQILGLYLKTSVGYKTRIYLLKTCIRLLQNKTVINSDQILKGILTFTDFYIFTWKDNTWSDKVQVVAQGERQKSFSEHGKGIF